VNEGPMTARGGGSLRGCVQWVSLSVSIDRGAPSNGSARPAVLDREFLSQVGG